MESLQQYLTLLKCEVPDRKTYSKNNEDERFPLLVPRETLKDVNRDSQQNNRKMEGSEKKSTSQKSTDNCEMTLKKLSVESGVQAVQAVEKMQEGGADKETHTPSEKKSERSKEVFSNTSSEEIKNAGSENCLVIKEEKIEEPIVRKPSGETPESCQNTVKAVGTEIGEESINSKDVLTQLKNCLYKENERKRRGNMSEKPPDTCPNDEVEREMGHERQWCTSKQEASPVKPQNLRLAEVMTNEEGENGKPSHETVKDKTSFKVEPQQEAGLWQYIQRKNREPLVGLSALLECHCDQRDPFYLCECCFLKIPEKDVISHVTGVDHQKIYLGLQKLPPPPGKNIRHLAALFEQDNGYGEAQVIDLDEEIYNNISKQNVESVIQTVKALLAQQDSSHELPSTSALPAVGTSVTLHAQHKVSSVMNNFQVVKMEIDDNSEDSEAQPPSVTAAVSVKTETTSETMCQDVKKTRIRVSEPADNANTHLTVSRSSGDASSLHMYTSGTDKSCLHPAATGGDLKAEIISNTTVEPLKKSGKSRIVGESQYATISDTALSTSTKFMTAISKCPARSSVASQTKVTSVATIEMNKTSVKCENTEASAKTVLRMNSSEPNADVAPSVPKSKAPHLTAPMSVRSENKNAPTEPSHTVTNKTKSSENLPKVGVNQLILVSCEDKLQVYCQLCLVRMKGSSHIFSFSHRYNYMKMIFPGAPLPELRSKLDKIVATIAEVEKNIGSQCSQKLEVKINAYQELAALPEDKALERLKEMLRQRDSQASSSRTDSAEALSPQVAFASPCGTSSPHDGMHMSQNEVAELSTDCQSEQENNHELQTLMVRIPVSLFKEEGYPAVGQSDRAQSLKSSETKANDLISDQLHSCLTLKDEQEPVATPRIQKSDMAVTVKQEKFEYDAESQATAEVTPAVESPAVKIEKPEGPADHLSTDSESTGRFAQTHDTCQKTANTRHQRLRSDPELQDTQKLLEDTQKPSPVKLFNPEPLPSVASVNTEQQNQPRPSQKAEHVPKQSGCFRGPGHHRASQTFPGTSIGERIEGHSHLSTYLKVKGLNTEPIIGLAFVWECRGNSLDSFFLCESCEERLFLSDICEHMVSKEHQYKYLWMHYPKFLSFWTDKVLLPEMKVELVNDTVKLLSERECYNKMDAQVVLLRQDSYNWVRMAPFSEALKMVQSIKKEPKPSVFSQPISTLQQQGARQKTSFGRDCSNWRFGQDQTKKNPLNVTSVSSKADSVVSPFPGVGTCHSPQQTCRSLSLQPELSPPVSQHQRAIPELQMKQAEMRQESLTSSITSRKISQICSLSPRDKCFPASKRLAVTSLETQVRPGTSYPQLKDPLLAKSTHGSQLPISQPSTESASESTVVKYPVPRSDEQGASIVDNTQFKQLMDLMRQTKLKLMNKPTHMTAPDNVETTTSHTDGSSKSSVKRRCDQKDEQNRSKKTKTQTTWDSKSPPSTNSLEGRLLTAAPVLSGCENQLVNPNANSSLEGYSAGGYLLFNVTEDRQDGTMLPSVSTYKTSDPRLRRVSAQNKFGNVSEFKPSPFQHVASNHSPGQVPHLQGHTDSNGGCQLLITTIITARSDPTNQQFMDTEQHHDNTEPYPS